MIFGLKSEDIHALVNDLAWCCCNCWNEHADIDDTGFGHGEQGEKIEMYLAHTTERGCQVPDCPFGRESQWFNLHHNDPSKRCTGETNDRINGKIQTTPKGFKKYLRRKDLVVMCEFHHRIAHKYDERDSGNKGLVYGGKDLPNLNAPSVNVWRCIRCNLINANGQPTCLDCGKAKQHPSAPGSAKRSRAMQ
jgi:hypothetical protein